MINLGKGPNHMNEFLPVLQLKGNQTLVHYGINFLCARARVSIISCLDSITLIKILL